MFRKRLGAAVAFIAVVVSPLLLECTTTCQVGNQNGYEEGHCPINLTPVPSQRSGEPYSECVTVHVWMKADDLSKPPRIEIVSPVNEIIIRPSMAKKNPTKKCKKGKCETRVHCHTDVMQQFPQSNTSFALWELVHDCVAAEADSVVTVSYGTRRSSCNVSYTVQGPMPDFDLSVNLTSKSINVTVEPGDEVYTRWCYRRNAANCFSPFPRKNTSHSALLNFPYLLPCVCVEAYYTYTDAVRRRRCPFENQSLTDVTDVWRSSKVTLHEHSFKLESVCPASGLKISASLCWRLQEHLCTPVFNATLEGTEADRHLVYSTSAVDKHPQMCVQFSVQGGHNVSCPFQAGESNDMSSWEVYIGAGRRSLFLYLTSSVAAKFSAQLCVLNDSGCRPVGEVHSATIDGNTSETRINMPFYPPAEKPCVQVWQSDPSLLGRRILCLDYKHKRCGLYAVAALIFVVIAALLVMFVHRLTKNKAAGWLCVQRPVLLVCSSELSAHVSGVCALASILQGELSATVHMALWGQSSQTKSRTGTGVADLGPLPWLYGQWDAVRKAQGRVLIVWSPEAKKAYRKWREERANVNNNETEKEDYIETVEMVEDLKLNGRRMGKCKKKKAARKKDGVEFCEDKECNPRREPSTVITPVFTAALACLEGALQGCKGQGVALVYFQGLCRSRDIPKALREVPRYCLPQDFRGLIQELGGMTRPIKTGETTWHCWPRLLTKLLSIWLARHLARKLQTQLPQTQGKKMQGPSVTRSANLMSDKTQSRLKLPLAANTAWPGTAQELEPLHGSPWRPQQLSSQVSRV